MPHLQRIEIQRERFPTREHYPFSLRLLQETEQVGFSTPITFFVGENGSGKSTMLEAIARAADIHIWRGVHKTRYENNPHEEMLYRCIRLHWENGSVPGSFFSVEIFRNYSRTVDSWAAASPSILQEYGGRSLLTQSHGQSLMAYFQSRYTRRGLFLMDEPETALSPRRQVELLNLLRRIGQRGDAQFVIATHSPILLACPEARILSFNRAPIGEIDYEDTDYFQVYRDFLADRDAFLE